MTIKNKPKRYLNQLLKILNIKEKMNGFPGKN